MKPNFSVDKYVQIKYGQATLDSCTRSKNCVSIGKVTGMVPASEPPMVKSKTERENDKELIELWYV